MNTKQSIAALALALAGASVFAADVSAPLTRADVQAELVRARAAGDLGREADIHNFTLAKAAPSGLTRAEVLAEVSRARAAGELPGYDTGYITQNVATHRSREEVRAEAIEASRDRVARATTDSFTSTH